MTKPTVKEALIAFFVAVPVSLMIAIDVAAFFWWSLILLVVLGVILCGFWKIGELVERYLD
jgi:hypothetical protein